MKYHFEIKNITVVDELPSYWTKKDYLNLLELFNYPGAEEEKPENLRELLFMAIGDFEPANAAEIVLTYKLEDHLTTGQISQISNDMLVDTVCEEYPEMELQAPLFHINQLLFKAYNGKFPSASATIIECVILPEDEENKVPLTKQQALQLLNFGLSDRNIVKRLFSEQMEQTTDFPEAENIIWELSTTDNKNYKIITAENLIKKDDLELVEFDASLKVEKD